MKDFHDYKQRVLDKIELAAGLIAAVSLGFHLCQWLVKHHLDKIEEEQHAEKAGTQTRS